MNGIQHYNITKPCVSVYVVNQIPNSPTSVWSGHQNNGHIRITWQKQIKKCKQIVHWLHWSEIGENYRTSTTDLTCQNFQKFGETSTTIVWRWLLLLAINDIIWDSLNDQSLYCTLHIYSYTICSVCELKIQDGRMTWDNKRCNNYEVSFFVCCTWILSRAYSSFLLQ